MTTACVTEQNYVEVRRLLEHADQDHVLKTSYSSNLLATTKNSIFTNWNVEEDFGPKNFRERHHSCEMVKYLNIF